jgi:hypothetical protein
MKKRRKSQSRIRSANEFVDMLARIVCWIFSMVCFSSGLIFLVTRDFAGGGILTSVGIVLALLARKLRHLKVKTGLFEIEAQPD